MTSGEKEKGFIQGIAWAAGFMAANHNEDGLAMDIVLHSGLTAEKFKDAIAYDLTQMRTGADLKEFLKGVRGKP